MLMYSGNKAKLTFTLFIQYQIKHSSIIETSFNWNYNNEYKQLCKP